jgi:hypothetical protein
MRKGGYMRRLAFKSALISISILCISAVALAGGNKLSSDNGNLLRGSVYKQSGIQRDGIITIRTKWNLPAVAPTYRYDFDILNGQVEQNHYSFLMGDIAEISMLPEEDGDQYMNVKLRNGVIHKLMLTSESKPVIGSVSLWMTDVSVLTEGYGENIIPIGEVSRIVFSPPSKGPEETMDDLVEDLSDALKIGMRDDLIDNDLAVVMEKIQKRMKARLLNEKKN